jgi:hypothetical protein
MHTQILIWLLFLLSIIDGNAYAQLPNGKPLPDGWEYVGTIPDSAFTTRIDKKSYHFIGDKIIIPSSFKDADSIVGVVISDDAGKTWSIRIFPFICNGVTNGVNPITGTLYAVGRESDSVWRFYVSNDLGLSFSRHEINKSLKYPTVPAPGFRSLNPHDTNDILLERSIQYAYDYGNDFYRSLDGGKTWRWVDYFPTAVDGSGQYSELVFDVRTPGLWYASVIGAYHGLTKTSHRSFDQGYTWEYIDHFGEYAGIGKEGELRSQWLYLNDFFHGFITSSAFGDGQIYIDWVKRALPNSNVSNRDSEYYIYMGKYTIDRLRPHTAFFMINENKSDPITHEPEFSNNFMFRTDNDGETFELLNLDYDSTRRLTIAGFSNADYTLYGFLGSKSYLVENGVVTEPYYYLVKRKLQKSVVELSGEYEHLKTTQIYAYPNPLDQKTTLTFENCTSGVMYMDVVNGLGVSVIREEIADVGGLQQYSADLSGLPVGAYHIRLSCPTDGWSSGTSVIKSGAAVVPWSLDLRK